MIFKTFFGENLFLKSIVGLLKIQNKLKPKINDNIFILLDFASLDAVFKVQFLFKFEIECSFSCWQQWL
jgi:hypothetical protein